MLHRMFSLRFRFVFSAINPSFLLNDPLIDRRLMEIVSGSIALNGKMHEIKTHEDSTEIVVMPGGHRLENYYKSFTARIGLNGKMELVPVNESLQNRH